VLVLRNCELICHSRTVPRAKTFAVPCVRHTSYKKLEEYMTGRCHERDLVHLNKNWCLPLQQGSTRKRLCEIFSCVEPCKSSLYVQAHCPGFGITTKSEGLAFRPAQVNCHKSGLPIFPLTLHAACRRTHAISHQTLVWSTLKASALQACCMLYSFRYEPYIVLKQLDPYRWNRLYLFHYRPVLPQVASVLHKTSTAKQY
jgi:hypothetical protein